MKMITVVMRHDKKHIYINPKRIECVIPLDDGCRILFPYLNSDGEICAMDVIESAASVIKQMDAL